MKFTILRIDKRIVTGELDDGTIIDVARKWFTEDIEEGGVQLNLVWNVAEMKRKKMGSYFLLATHF